MLIDIEKGAIDNLASCKFLSRIYIVTIYQKGSSTILILNRVQGEEIKHLKDYKDFKDMFLEAQAGILALYYNYKHAIKLEAGKRPL
jgi:hypothetical protein